MKTEYKNLLIKIIKKYLPNTKIYLFGSRARKTNTPGSDIDLAIDSETKIDFKIISKIKNDIEESKIPFFVDVLDIQSVSEEMKKEIIVKFPTFLDKSYMQR